MAVHQGSWFGLPDFGVTEAIQKYIAPQKQYTTQGGSNLFGVAKPAQTNTLGVLTGPVQGPPIPTGISYPSGGYIAPQQTQQTQQSQQQQSSGGSSGPSYEDQVRGDINSGYDSYFGQLDQMLGTLPTQKTALEGQVNSQFDKGVADLQGQQQVGMTDIQGYRDKATSQQERSLRGLAEDIQNQYQAGNIFLGARGAGDSSAANQYAYAVSKQGSKQRGDIMNKTSDVNQELDLRAQKLGDIYNTETTKMKADRDTQIGSVGQWFYQQQNALQQAKANGQLQKGQDLANLSKQLLSAAMQQISNVQANYQSQNNALQQWAMSNSQNITQLRGNMQAVSQYQMPTIANSSILGSPQLQANNSIYVPGNIGGYNDQTNNQLMPNSLVG